MENTSQWETALLIGIPIAAFFVWFNKSGSDFRNGFEAKSQKKKL